MILLPDCRGSGEFFLMVYFAFPYGSDLLRSFRALPLSPFYTNHASPSSLLPAPTAGQRHGLQCVPFSLCHFPTRPHISFSQTPHTRLDVYSPNHVYVSGSPYHFTGTPLSPYFNFRRSAFRKRLWRNRRTSVPFLTSNG